MPYYTSWDEFSKAAEKLYLSDPSKARVVLKYRHCDGSMKIKVTDDTRCLQYKTEHAKDMKKLEKFNSTLMRHMVSK